MDRGMNKKHLDALLPDFVTCLEPVKWAWQVSEEWYLQGLEDKNKISVETYHCNA